MSCRPLCNLQLSGQRQESAQLHQPRRRGRHVVGEVRGPHEAAFLRLATAVVIEAHDEWQVTRRYLSEISMAELRKVIAAKQTAEKPVAEQLQIA